MKIDKGTDMSWKNFCYKIEALFRKDPEVHVKINEKEHDVTLYVDNYKKARAIRRLIPCYKIFGDTILKINVYDGEDYNISDIELFDEAFSGNPAVELFLGDIGIGDDDDSVEDAADHYYIVFKNEVVQYQNDNPFEWYKAHSTLYQDIAEEVFGKKNNITYCTDTLE